MENTEEDEEEEYEGESEEYGDEDDYDEDDGESYGDESEDENGKGDDLEFENENEDIDSGEQTHLKSSDLSTEVSNRSPGLKPNSKRLKSMEEIDEESGCGSEEEDLIQVADFITNSSIGFYGKTVDVRQSAINLDMGCPKEILVKTIIQRSNSSLSQMERASSIMRIAQQSPLIMNQQINNISNNNNNNYITHYENNDYEARDPYTQDHPVYLLRSLFEKRPPVIFFQYPPQCGKKREENYTYKMKEGKYRLRFRISDQVHTYNCVVNNFCKGGFAQTDGSYWNVLWSAPLKPECMRNYDQYKKCNHFPGTFQLGRKDNMYRHISKMIREYGEEFRIVPKTWILPEDTRRFQKEREDVQEPKLWIVKPANSSCGRGIRILTKTSQLPKKGQHVVCEYIMKPHLINGYKYDLRLYVFITSYEPLTIYLYQEGLVRFATQPYNTKNTKIRFAHLTNFSVNKKATNFKAADENSNSQSQQASKWSLKMLREAFKQLDIDYDSIFVKIKDLIIKSILSVEPIIANNMQRASKNRHLCFELYGFDVILDSDLRPWLLEVNVLPSLSSSSQLDKRIKTSLLSDIFQTIGIVPYNKKKAMKEFEAQKWEKFSGIQTMKTQQFNQEYKPDNPTQAQNSQNTAITQQNQDSSISKTQDCDESLLDDLYIHKQSITSPTRIRLAKELSVTQKLSDLNYEEQLVIVEKLEEQSRSGEFERIFPVKNTVDSYFKYFKSQRATNLIFWRWLKMKKEDKLNCLKQFKVNKNQAELLNKLIMEY